MITTLIASALSLLLAATGTPAAPNAPQATLAGLTPSATTRIGKTADWVLPTDDAVWVASTGPFAVHRLDPKTRGVVASVPLPGEACAGLTIAAGQLWVPLCGKPNALARVDLATNRLVDILPLGPAAAEGGITAGGGSVWMVTDAKGRLAEIDAATGQLRRTLAVPAGSFNPLYRDGQVWVTGHDTGGVTVLDAVSGTTLATLPVGPGPRFLTSGGGAIWVLLQGTGEVVKIDAATRTVVARVPAGLVGPGGDIAYGAGQVWPTLIGTPLTRIDGQTQQILRQWTGPGGDSLAWAFDGIWLTDYKGGTVAYYPAASLGVH